MPVDRARAARIIAVATPAHMDTGMMVVAEAETIVPDTMTTAVAADETDSLETLLFGNTRQRFLGRGSQARQARETERSDCRVSR